MPKKKVLRGIIAFVIFVVGCCIAPQVETDTPDIPDVTISTEATTNSTTDATSDTTQGTEGSGEQTTPPTTNTTTPPTTETTTPPTTQTPTTTPPANSSFEVHFIDVGQADAALVLCDGKLNGIVDARTTTKEEIGLLMTHLREEEQSNG